MYLFEGPEKNPLHSKRRWRKNLWAEYELMIFRSQGACSTSVLQPLPTSLMTVEHALWSRCGTWQLCRASRKNSSRRRLGSSGSEIIERLVYRSIVKLALLHLHSTLGQLRNSNLAQSPLCSLWINLWCFWAIFLSVKSSTNILLDLILFSLRKVKLVRAFNNYYRK